MAKGTRRQWTDEQRKAASDRAKARGFGGNTQPVAAAATPEQVLIAKQQATAPVRTQEDLRELIGKEEQELVEKGTVTHQRPDRVAVWKQTRNGWQRREIPGTALNQALASGFKARCPDCGGECGDGVNDCPGRENTAFRRCPVCARPIFDLEIQHDTEGEAEEAEIRDESFSQTTPTVRTKVKLEAHMIAYHPAEAQAYGIVRPSPGKQPEPEKASVA